MSGFLNVAKSKTFWAGVALIVTGIGEIVDSKQELGMLSIGNGLGMIFLRHAIYKGTNV